MAQAKENPTIPCWPLAFQGEAKTCLKDCYNQQFSDVNYLNIRDVVKAHYNLQKDPTPEEAQELIIKLRDELREHLDNQVSEHLYGSFWEISTKPRCPLLNLRHRGF